MMHSDRSRGLCSSPRGLDRRNPYTTLGPLLACNVFLELTAKLMAACWLEYNNSIIHSLYWHSPLMFKSSSGLNFVGVNTTCTATLFI
jgi:hypothetical protein